MILGIDTLGFGGILAAGLPHDDGNIHLMLRIKHGDHQAFNEVRRKYKPVIRNFLVGLGCPESLLEDIIQEVFTRVWDNRKKYQPISTVKSFLRGLARKIWYGQRRHDKRQAAAYQQLSLAFNPCDHDSEPVAILERRESAGAAKQAKSKLPDKQRQAVELVFESGLSHAEAAKQAGCSVNVFYQRFYQGRSRMAEMLREFK